MIYSVTFNPSLDYIVSVDPFDLGMTNRTNSEKILPGGKGLNVSIVLKNLGIESTALGFCAGFTGKEIQRLIEQEGINNRFVETKEGFSRINVKLKNIEGTEINGMGPFITQEDIENLLNMLDDMKEGDTLVLAGSIPSCMPNDMYQSICRRYEKKNITIVVDATKELLLKVLEYHPFLIKPNNHELGEIFGVTLSDRKSVIPYAKKMQELGARNVLVSMAGMGAVLVAENGEVYETQAPKGNLINGVGAGDSMVAGFLAGWLRTKDYGKAFNMGVATGSASAFSESLATLEEVEKVLLQLEKMDLTK